MWTFKHKYSEISADYSDSRGVFFLSMILDGPSLPHLVYHHLAVLCAKGSSK
ncbi:hypothetical protein BT93_L3166 [Corymbia citriodora subsp. variegata]|uniref:Uncharacterized protein n=1 Tax=Corymbia citriodora subsp. variegata TaxID=360336 RepID=A0A8T0CHZ5_CORYI|nr:hypothetical protein BT93_L3166 [Corymbia citriodora subsp. variegata]